MTLLSNIKVIVSGGGTGGHIFPAIAIANALERKIPNVELLFVGAQGKMEMTRVPEAGYKIIGLPIEGIQRKLTLKNLILPFKLLKSLWMSMRIVSKFRPNLAVGVGGYASGPVLQAANWKGIPTLIQEQNSYPGMTNKILAKKANIICVVFKGMEQYFSKEKIRITGSPIRSEIISFDVNREEANQDFGLQLDRPIVLVTGGSLGAGSINAAIAKDIEKYQTSNIQLIWQTGSYYYEQYKHLATEQIKIKPFISKMVHAYAVADIVVSRAGGVIGELRVIGKPCVLIPSPNVTEDHQTHNAMNLVKDGACVMVKDNEIQNKLFEQVTALLDDKELQQTMSKALKSGAVYDAADRIAIECISLMQTEVLR